MAEITCPGCGTKYFHGFLVCPSCSRPTRPRSQEIRDVAAGEVGRNNYALAGLILGITSIFLYVIGILPILAIVFSAIGLSKVNHYGGGGSVQGAIGLVLGIIFTLLYMKAYGHI